METSGSHGGYGTILFDLDGTLTDPKEGITKSVAYALAHFGIEVDNLDSLNKFIGPSLAYSFKEYYGLDGEDNATAIQKYREIFADTGIYQNELYTGMYTLLGRLVAAGKTLLVATAKPTVYAKIILEIFDIAQYFTAVVGSELNGHRTDKAEVIAEAMRTAGISSPDNCIMVGDRKYDIIGATQNGMDSVGVLYGYGDYEELLQAQPTHIAADLQQLEDILLG